MKSINIILCVILIIATAIIASGCASKKDTAVVDEGILINPEMDETDADTDADDEKTPVDDKADAANSGGNNEPVIEKRDVNPGNDSVCYILDVLYEQNKENVIYSPLSLNMALALVAEGANGQTKEQIDAFLQTDDYSTECADYIKNISGKSLENGTVNVANAVFSDKTIKLNKDYIKHIKKKYSATADELDFRDNAKTASKINDWCAKNTNNMIPSIVDEAAVNNSEDAAILTNAVYFESDWVTPFEVDTFTEPFFNADDTESEIYYLYGEGNAYYENENATGFEYPYKNGHSFIGILPKQEGDFALSDIDLDSFLANRRTDYDEINVRMPSFEFDTDNKILKQALISMGITDMFDENKADFSNMCEKPFRVDDIIQKCKIKLDENGTLAAAVTEIGMVGCTAFEIEPSSVDVVLNRPFAFLIIDRESGLILFAGKVSNK